MPGAALISPGPQPPPRGVGAAGVMSGLERVGLLGVIQAGSSRGLLSPGLAPDVALCRGRNGVLVAAAPFELGQAGGTEAGPTCAARCLTYKGLGTPNAAVMVDVLALVS